MQFTLFTRKGGFEPLFFETCASSPTAESEDWHFFVPNKLKEVYGM